MSLLSALFGGSNKTATTTTTTATQETVGATDQGAVNTGAGALDYRFTDSRDLSVNNVDMTRNTVIDNTHVENLAGDAIQQLLYTADRYDQRRSAEAMGQVQGAYNASLAFFDKGIAAVQAVTTNADPNSALSSTVNNGMKYALYAVLAIAGFAALRSA